MYSVQWLSPNNIWHTYSSLSNENSAIQTALRLAHSGRYHAVRVITRSGSVVYCG